MSVELTTAPSVLSERSEFTRMPSISAQREQQTQLVAKIAFHGCGLITSALHISPNAVPFLPPSRLLYVPPACSDCWAAK